MLEPVSIPPSPAATHPNNMATTTKQQQDLDALRNAAVRDQQQTPRGVLNHSSSGEWSDKDGKDSMSSPGMPPHHELNRSESIGSARVEHAASSTLQTPRAWMGLAPMATVDEELDHAEHNHFFWSKVKIAFKEPFAEFWGTFVLVLFGTGSIAQTLLTANDTSAPGADGFGSWVTITWGWGIGLMLGIYIAGDSGAFLNPAVCLASCMFRKLPWRRLPMYWLAEFTGAFAAAAVVYGNYIGLINAYESGARSVAPSETATAGIFATYPSPSISTTSAFFDQFIGSALLVFIIFALQDDSNKGKFVASGAWFPLCLFFTLTGIGIAFGAQTGFAINPARDLGPRLLTAAVGYGRDVWSAGDYYFWIPIVAPFVGCPVGGFLYDAFVYTGETPVNTPWFGLKQLFTPHKMVQNRLERQKAEGMV
ncbi:hypothetical protein CKM354_000581100 [Cercospora kikuchii]|uniref:Aquaporin n=1 Tax=Cercospora kikuchii TaxID=84275 RepID=A0A9P3CE15_9PEZI|nr:uncharacterized protein CKM354_000581100 [Cercospora kikuchii]GIZ42549.1 hypothetical protein CKM354_000581100 [Cercospora kikuchii]